MMNNILSSENIIVGISVIVYAIVFIIQKAQFNKQNEILNKYEKIFSIFNVDEIEKYVELQKKSINLSLNNREVELSHNEKTISTRMSELEIILNNSKANLEKTGSIRESLDSYGIYLQTYMTELDNLTKLEFEGLYQIMEKNISVSKYPDLHLKILRQMLANKEKYKKMKNEVFMKMIRNIQDLMQD